MSIKKHMRILASFFILGAIVLGALPASAASVTASQRTPVIDYSPNLGSVVYAPAGQNPNISYDLGKNPSIAQNPSATSYHIGLNVKRVNAGPTGSSQFYNFDLKLGTDSTLGSATTYLLPSGNITENDTSGSGHAYDINMTGLAPATTYYFQILDKKYNTVSSILSFQTLAEEVQEPGGGGGTGNDSSASVTAAVSGVDNDSGQVSATVSSGTVGGLNALYGTVQQPANMDRVTSLNPGNQSNSYSASLVSLASCTTYYYVITDAVNSGTYYTPVKSFQTTGCNNQNDSDDPECAPSQTYNDDLNVCVMSEAVVTDSNTPGQSGGTTKLTNPLGSEYDSFPKVVVAIIDNIVIPVAIPFVALAIIWTGFQFVVARGNPIKLKEAKKALGWTLIGAAVILGAYVIGQVIQSTIQEIRGGETTVVGFISNSSSLG